ncbi:hypothetical protein [Merismopedia glauca]|uniref:hypothetical protein n=1 Tax=Merismopedia glauca TaxID=292586 RepID=UPI0015E637B3|nr:hypothetical protein [Merismopedia glauca]
MLVHKLLSKSSENVPKLWQNFSSLLPDRTQQTLVENHQPKPSSLFQEIWEVIVVD